MNKSFSISVTKLTPESLMRRACEMTFLGTSQQSLASMYKSEHSPSRTQMFWVELKSIPLFVSTHLLRHHVGLIPYQLTCRDDRKGGNVAFPEKIESVQSRVSDLTTMLDRGVDSVEFEKLYESIQDDLEDLKTTADRLTPVNLGFLVNAQSLIDMSKVRLCLLAHKSTVAIFKQLKQEIAAVDPDLADMMVVKCVYRNGLCGEPRCCGYNESKGFQKELTAYKQHFCKR